MRTIVGQRSRTHCRRSLGNVDDPRRRVRREVVAVIEVGARFRFIGDRDAHDAGDEAERDGSNASRQRRSDAVDANGEDAHDDRNRRQRHRDQDEQTWPVRHGQISSVIQYNIRLLMTIDRTQLADKKR